MSTKLASGVVHTIPKDMRSTLVSGEDLVETWNGLTPLARNEWICWVSSPKKAETREDHIRRLKEDLRKGKRRPCCWMGCVHRVDKKMSASQKFILRGAKKR